jgi:hypothetical protein
MSFSLFCFLSHLTISVFKIFQSLRFFLFLTTFILNAPTNVHYRVGRGKTRFPFSHVFHLQTDSFIHPQLLLLQFVIADCNHIFRASTPVAREGNYDNGKFRERKKNRIAGDSSNNCHFYQTWSFGELI